MCAGCDAMREFNAVIDAHIARELPKMMAQPLDTHILMGTHKADA